MRLDYIKCHNFFVHRDTQIQFDEIESPILIIGQNGAGKSSFFVESITYAIFGETRLESSDEAILDNEDEMSVEVGFTLANREIVIERSKRRGKSQKLSLWIDGNDVTELLTETQRRIDGLFGLSYNSFLSSVILKQEDADFFVRAKADERKKIISEILDLGYYERMEKLAKTQRTDIKAEIKAADGVLNAIEVHDTAELMAHLKTAVKAIKKHEKLLSEVEDGLAQINEQNAAIKAKLDAYQELKSANEKVHAALKKQRADLERRKDELEELAAFVGSYEDPSEEIQSLEARMEEVNHIADAVRQEVETLEEAHRARLSEHDKSKSELDCQISEIREAIAAHKGERKSVEKALDKFENLAGQCPTCLQDIDAKHKHELETNFSDVLTTHDGEISKLTEKLNVHVDAANELMESRADVVRKHGNKVKELRRTIAEAAEMYTNSERNRRLAEKRQNQFEIAKERCKTATEAVEQIQSAIKDLQEQVRPLSELGDLAPIDTQAIRAEQRRLRKELDELISAQASIEHMIKSSEKAEEDRRRLKSELVVKRRRLNLLEKLCVAFSRNGIPATIISTVLPEIQDTANTFLGKMSQGMLEIQFRTIELTKSGEERETLEIDVFDGIKWRPFDSYSGGERFRVSLAIRLALSKVLTRRSGIDLELLILDEPASALDTPGKNSFIETLQSLSDTFSRIIVMSHLPDISDDFSSKVYIAKTDSGSMITY